MGIRSAEKFAKVLGSKKAVIVDPSYAMMKNPDLVSEEIPKDANDALRKGLDLKQILKESTRYLESHTIVSVQDLSQMVVSRILNQDRMKGIQA